MLLQDSSVQYLTFFKIEKSKTSTTNTQNIIIYKQQLKCTENEVWCNKLTEHKNHFYTSKSPLLVQNTNFEDLLLDPPVFKKNLHPPFLEILKIAIPLK